MTSERAHERAGQPFDRTVELDGRGHPGGRHLLGTPLAAMTGNYAVRAALRLPEPRHGADVSAAELRLNADPDRWYAIRLRVRTGVRYLSVLRHADGHDELLADDICAFDFDRWLPVEVTVADGRITVAVDGRVATTVTDPDPLDGGGVGVTAVATAAGFAPVEVVDLGPRAVPAVGRPSAAPDPAAALVQPFTAVEGAAYRLEVTAVRGDDRSGYATHLLIRDGHGWERVGEPLGERWVVLHGENGSRRDPQRTLDAHPVWFDAVEPLGPDAVRLHGDGELFSLTVTWRLAGRHPSATIELVPRVDGRFVVAYRAFAAAPDDEVDEVLCGPLRHARMVGGPASVGRDELFAPMCLVQRGPVTTGLFAPASELPFEYESARGDDDQPFGMSLRTPDGAVQPTLYAPQYGRRADRRAGEPYRFTVGVYAAHADLYDAYRDLLRGEYGYTAYRRNVHASLTDTVHHLIDLMKAGPTADDRVDYQGSPSGWWSRAKGFIDIENDQAVRATTTSVLLGAYLLTGDDELYERRALPTVEFHLSRNGYGWTPRQDATVYGDPTRNALCGTPFGAPALAPLHTLSRGALTAARDLALSALDTQDYWLKRTPISAPLAAYRMTGDAKLRQQAEEAADRYVAEELDQPYGGEADPHDFAVYYCRAWVELLEMYEETGRRRYLDAAYREAKRFVTMVFARPVPDGTVTVPQRPLFVDRQIELTGWWDPAALYQYPADDVPDEQVPAWQVSPTGLGIEAVNTYRFNGFTLNPAWAPFLLRLAAHSGDDLLRDVAHNALVGRFTNYPGYYYRQFTVHHLRPDFPYTGPFGNTTIYYHHAPAQLGMTVDYLVAEHETRSGGAISFPGVFEQTYVWFAYRVHGHAPGRFHGEDGVWLWLPKGLVRLDTEQVNWIAADGGDRLCLSLTNAAATPTTVTVTLDPARVPMAPGQPYRAAVIHDRGAPQETVVVDHRLTVDVSGHGITAVIVYGLALDVPLHRAAAPVGAHQFGDGPDGAVRGILIPKPDGSRYHAHVQAATREPATLHWSLDDGATWRHLDRDVLPTEWTVPVDDVSAAFTYVVQVGDRRSRPVRLACGTEA
ncbi:hypothetical protein [Micromonospora sp. WMMD812]|uniref:hypothetical protein n=1 Tax=Micromonospora sp. WMMD812 TaxID=3015152 RepID=UPI00248C5464|nr:hypothetical protein [Micromonospora sp. WMMD812]WBB69386.1 hypothetical protein O7603_08560 [Micromonospora sp. WMMD812]